MSDYKQTLIELKQMNQELKIGSSLKSSLNLATGSSRRIIDQSRNHLISAKSLDIRKPQMINHSQSNNILPEIRKSNQSQLQIKSHQTIPDKDNMIQINLFDPVMPPEHNCDCSYCWCYLLVFCDVVWIGPILTITNGTSPCPWVISHLCRDS